MIEAARQALEALQKLTWAVSHPDNVKIGEDGQNTLRQAIEQAERQQALDKKAENARELGLDYEPVPWIENMTIDSTNELSKPTKPVQEPVAWMDGYRNIYSLEEKAAGCPEATIPLVPIANQQKTSGSPIFSELHCICGAEWEWHNHDWELVTTPQPQQAEKQVCVACEGNPQGENIPCAVCGATPQPQPNVATNDTKQESVAKPQEKRHEWVWMPAPIKTQWGHDMVVADLAVDKDHTVSVYCERDQTAKVEAMFKGKTT